MGRGKTGKERGDRQRELGMGEGKDRHRCGRYYRHCRNVSTFIPRVGGGGAWDVSLVTRRWVSLHIHLLESSRTPALLPPLTNISRQLPRVPPSPIPISLWDGEHLALQS